MNQDLDKLKEVIDDSFDPESHGMIADLEKRLHYEVVKEDFIHNSVVEEYLTSLAGEIANCKAQLSEQEDLTDRDRIKIFARIRACKEFLSHFTPKRAEIENEIKQTLNEVTRQRY